MQSYRHHSCWVFSDLDSQRTRCPACFASGSSTVIEAESGRYGQKKPDNTAITERWQGVWEIQTLFVTLIFSTLLMRGKCWQFISFSVFFTENRGICFALQRLLINLKCWHFLMSHMCPKLGEHVCRILLTPACYSHSPNSNPVALNDEAAAK